MNAITKTAVKTALLLLLTSGFLLAGEPCREAGLTVHQRADKSRDGWWRAGFVVTDPATKQTGASYDKPEHLIHYFESLPQSVQQNGIWIVTMQPSAYSEDQRDLLKVLIYFCTHQGIPIYTCRASELPNGWQRAKRR